MKTPQSTLMIECNGIERIPASIYDSKAEAVGDLADHIIARIKKKNAEGHDFVMGLPTGSTPLALYRELIKRYKAGEISFRRVIGFNLDEYYPMQPDSPQSYHRFMKENFFDHVDMAPEKIHIPPGHLSLEETAEACHAYEEAIRQAGGIDLQLLGIGRTGHIGFNEPGSSLDSITRMVTLDRITRADAAADFGGEDYVPRRAVTMGVATIMAAKEIIMLAWGHKKAPVFRDMLEGPITPARPATFLQNHPRTRVLANRDAASELTRFHAPWLTGSCSWDDRQMRKAVIWLCEETDKPILKLTDRDYTEHGLSELLSLKGPSYNINIKIFNDLQHTISGWPGGKPGADDTYRPEKNHPFPKRVVIFSPHPDDDVISMGGTFARLVEQGHQVHVAYQTSGNIAVPDDYVLSYLEFIENTQTVLTGLSPDFTARLQRVKQELTGASTAERRPSPELLQMKGFIRRGEALAACRFIGIPDEQVHFLDLPFYETGGIKKKRPSGEDRRIVTDFLNNISPHQIYAAGDLADPHGTHKTCMEIILEALSHLDAQEWLQKCSVWLYRGAWQEWNLEKVDMAVPISPDELRKKTRAILQHRSQKDGAMFPGEDQREFWQRAEQRNRGTADLYDKLGMAEYEAIEVFARYSKGGELFR